MKHIGYFFRSIFGEIIDRLSYQIRYKMTDIANSKIEEAVEKPFSQKAKNDQQTATSCQERNTKN